MSGVKRFHISSSVKSTAGAIRTMPATEAGPELLRRFNSRTRQQRQPTAHRRADQNLRAAAAGVEHRKTVGKPAADRTVGESAFGFAMAGIVEPHATALFALRPFRQRHRLGALHVGLVAAEPEQAGRRYRQSRARRCRGLRGPRQCAGISGCYRSSGAVIPKQSRFHLRATRCGGLETLHNGEASEEGNVQLKVTEHQSRRASNAHCR